MTNRVVDHNEPIVRPDLVDRWQGRRIGQVSTLRVAAGLGVLAGLVFALVATWLSPFTCCLAVTLPPIAFGNFLMLSRGSVEIVVKEDGLECTPLLGPRVSIRWERIVSLRLVEAPRVPLGDALSELTVVAHADDPRQERITIAAVGVSGTWSTKKFVAEWSASRPRLG